MAADKKPVWVDEDAHALLKTWAKMQKRPMVEVASALVLERLPALDPAVGLEAGKAAKAGGDKAAPEKKAAEKPAPEKKAAEQPAPEKKAAAKPAPEKKAEPAKATAAPAEKAESIIFDGPEPDAIVSAPREKATADAPADAEVTSVDRPSRDVRPIRDSHSKDKRYLGGIWLV